MESYEIARQALTKRMKELEIEIEDNFVPFSVSRSKNEKMWSLNWTVIVRIKGRRILVADYTAGIGHTPAMKLTAEQRKGRMLHQVDIDAMAKIECEEGREVRAVTVSGNPIFKRGALAKEFVRIRPDPIHVMCSLFIDSDALDYPTFEEWAPAVGFDPDSRRGEAVYRACLEIGLRLRNALGDSTMKELRALASQL